MFDVILWISEAESFLKIHPSTKGGLDEQAENDNR